jgi:hypothetical protein
MPRNSKELVDELAHHPDYAEADNFDQLLITSLLFTRMEGEREMHTSVADQNVPDTTFDTIAPEIRTRLNPEWVEVGKTLDLLVETNPDRAFEAAVAMCLLKRGESDEQESVNKWIRTTGLTLMGDKRINGKKLRDYLNNGEHGSQLLMFLIDQLKQDISRFNTDEAFHDGQGFLTLQTIYICRNIEWDVDHSAIREGLAVLADTRAGDSDVQTAAEIAYKWDGCGQFNELRAAN